VAGCSQPADPALHRQFFALGTLIDITIYGSAADTAERAATEIEQLFTRLHADWHAWQPGTLQATNRRLAMLESFPADPELLPLLHTANRLSRLSDGLFNPAIGELIALWGFHSDARPDGPPPDNDRILELIRQNPSVSDIILQDGHLHSHNPAVRYDLGAVAKGYAIDRGIELLQTHGIDNAILNAGGDLRATGRHGDRPWRIGIRDPRGPGVLAAIELGDDESVFTSGDYERFFDHDGTRYHHIIDPRTGYPADTVTSVTVIHTDAATADAAATALFVAGPELWQIIARQMGIRYVMLIDHNGTIHMNPAMQQRVTFDTAPAAVRLSKPL
jgi:thiamine biosynthesis lipoprotein